MFPEDWAPPCGKRCTEKYAAITQMPWRIFCKKGCSVDGDDWEECVEECNEICYKDPVLKDREWSAYLDRSPGSESYSLECFRACVSGCSFKFDIPSEETEKVQPKRPPKPKPEPVPILPIASKPPSAPLTNAITPEDDVPSTSA